MTRHLVWNANDGALPTEEPASVEIVEELGAVFLFRLNEGGACVADTWHEDVAAAKSQAAFEYGIADEDWTPVS